MKNKIILLSLLLVAIVFISGCVQQSTTQTTSEPNSASLDSFAQCLTDKGVKMYGSYICSACLAQIKMFGSHEGSFKYVDYIECHPRGPNPQTSLCLQRDIKATPTWILEKDGTEIKRLVGLQSFESLEEFSDCQLK